MERVQVHTLSEAQKKNLWTGGHHGNGKAQRLVTETRLIMERER